MRSNAAFSTTIADQDRRELCRKLRSDEADRARRAGRCVHLRRSGMDGLRFAEKADQGRHAGQSARQQAGADRAEGFEARRRDDRTGLRSRQACRRRPHRHRRRARGAGRTLCQGGAGKARRMDRRRAENGDGGKCARGVGAGRPRRGAARDRVRDRRQGRTECEDYRRVSRRFAPADHLSVRIDRDRECRRRAISVVPALAGRQGDFREIRIHRI